MEDSKLSKTPLDAQSLAAPPNELKYSKWTYEENKLFKIALSEIFDTSPHLFERIAIRVPGRTVKEVKDHYKAIVKHFEIVDEGGNQMPWVATNDEDETIEQNPKSKKMKVSTSYKEKTPSVASNSPRLWINEEHESFIRGFEKHERSWANISKSFVKSKTPTQVGNHGKRYLKKQAQVTNVTNINNAATTAASSSNPSPFPNDDHVNVLNDLVDQNQVSADPQQQPQLPPDDDPLRDTATSVNKQNHFSNDGDQPKSSPKLEDDPLDWEKYFPLMFE